MENSNSATPSSNIDQNESKPIKVESPIENNIIIDDDQNSDHSESNSSCVFHFEFETLPLEIRVLILSFSSDRLVLKFATISKLYKSLILGSDGDEFSGIRNTMWRNRLLSLVNGWRDSVNTIVANNGVDTSQLELFTEKSLDFYIEKNVEMIGGYGYYELLMYLKAIKYKHQANAKRKVSDTGVTLQKRTIRNNNVLEWNSFLCEKFHIAKSVEHNPIAFKGYEIVIEEFHKCANTWRLAYGIGTDYPGFNIDSSSTQFLRDNNGIGLVVENYNIKALNTLKTHTFTGELEPGSPIKLGDRFGLVVDFNELKIYFFKNGIHIKTVSNGVVPNTVYHPVISLCPKKTVTLYPLFDEYPINPKVPDVYINTELWPQRE